MNVYQLVRFRRIVLFGSGGTIDIDIEVIGIRRPVIGLRLLDGDAAGGHILGAASVILVLAGVEGLERAVGCKVERCYTCIEFYVAVVRGIALVKIQSP